MGGIGSGRHDHKSNNGLSKSQRYYLRHREQCITASSKCAQKRYWADPEKARKEKRTQYRMTHPIDKTHIRPSGYCKPGLEATAHPSMRDIVLAAGWVEGEGSFGPSTVQLDQKDVWILHRLKVLFGGAICKPPRKNKTCSTWHISGARARGFMMTIYSLLSPRRKIQVRRALGV